MKKKFKMLIFAAAILLSASFAAAQEIEPETENLPQTEETNADAPPAEIKELEIYDTETEISADLETEENAAAANPEESQIPTEENYFDDFDSLFDGATDVSVEEQNATAEKIFPEETEKDDSPIKFHGRLNAEAGIGFEIIDYFDPQFGATFENDLGFVAHVGKEASIQGTIHAEFPDFSLSLSELYLDYLLLNRVYVTLGIKELTWGYPMLFSDQDLIDEILEPKTGDSSLDDLQTSGSGSDVAGNADAGDNSSEIGSSQNTDAAKIPRTSTAAKLMPNVMYDSKNQFSLLFRFPVKLFSFNFAVMYPRGAPLEAIDSQNLSWRNIAYAASVETVFKNIALNVFFRTYSNKEEGVNKNLPHVLGLEAKGTVLGADIYGQYMMRMTNDSLISMEKYDAFVFTGGFYKYWETKTNRLFGGNIEYQYAFFPWGTQQHHHALRLIIGATRLGPARNLRPAIELYHDFMNVTGYLKAGLQVMNIFPKVHWKNGVQLDYGGTNSPLPKWKVGTTFILNLDY